jgi:hypothetical protein
VDALYAAHVLGGVTLRASALVGRRLGVRALARLVHSSCGAEASRKSAISVDGARARLAPNPTFRTLSRVLGVSNWRLSSLHAGPQIKHSFTLVKKGMLA